MNDKASPWQALVAAQAEFGKALKVSENTYHQSSYAPLDQVIDAVRPALNNNGFYLLQRTHQTDDGVTVSTDFIHESGHVFEMGVIHLPTPKKDPQGYGSAITYARRYSLLAACGMAQEDDDGNATIEPNPKVSKKVATISQDQIAQEVEDFHAVIAKAETVEQLRASIAPFLKWADGLGLIQYRQRFIDLATARAVELKSEGNQDGL